MKVKSKPKPKIQSSTPLPTPPDEDFSFAIAKVAVSQICESVGFKSTAIPAIQTLTLVATKYLQSIANSTVSYSAAANRTQSNLFDLINALHDHLRPVHGFPGASNLHRTDFCLIKSSVLLELANFVKNTDEVPFAKPIPRPENSARKSNPAPAPRPPHIPKWLPELPIVSSGEGSCSDDRRNGEKLWENSCSAVKIDGIVIENGNNERVILEIGAKREKVRFKIGRVVEKGDEGLCLGVNLKSRGKRVCWANHSNVNGSRKLKLAS
ncbi:hypothetical protein UlMin_012599 [Ulmus minor]